MGYVPTKQNGFSPLSSPPPLSLIFPSFSSFLSHSLLALPLLCFFSSFLPSVLPSFPPSLPPSLLPSVLPSFLPSFLPSVLPSFLSFFPCLKPLMEITVTQGPQAHDLRDVIGLHEQLRVEFTPTHLCPMQSPSPLFLQVSFTFKMLTFQIHISQ